MDITKKALEDRITALTQAKDQHLASANAAHGAMIECQYWLSILAQDEPKLAEPKKRGRPKMVTSVTSEMPESMIAAE